jgi:hypothetical protein
MERLLMRALRFHRARSLAGALLGALSLAACGGGLGDGPGVGSLTPPPGQLPAEQSAEAALLGGADHTVRDPSLNWGVGVLRPAGADGFVRIDLPLFEGARGRHWGWLTQGSIYDQGSGRTLPARADAAVEISGARAFPVLEHRDDGWMLVRYGGPQDRGQGLAWTHADLAQRARASFLPWARALEGAQGLVFRNADAAHNLRGGPSTDAAVVERLEGLNFDMTALEIRGDWMQVRVSTPPACAGSVAEDLLLGGGASRETTGWIAWRSNDRGPWVESVAGPRCGGGV